MGLVQRRGPALGAAIVAASAAIAGCGGSKDDDAKPAAAATATTEAPAPAPAAIPAPGADDAIVRAVDVVAAQKGGMAVSMRGTIAGDGQKTAKVRGNGKIDRARGRGTFTVITNAGATDLAVREVLDDGQLYLTSKLFTNKLPGQRSWMRIDLGKLQDAKGFNQAALGTNGPSQDPSQVLDYLHGAGPAKRVGTAKIRGAQTTHYRAEVDLKRALKEADGKAASQRSIQALLDVLGDKTTIPVDVWLDGDHRVLRERVSYKATLQGVQNTMKFTTDFTKFDVPVAVDTPPSSDTVDGLKLLAQNQQQPQG